MNILLTGATGFIGRSLLPVLAKQHRLVCLVRHGEKQIPDQNGNIETIVCEDLAGNMNFHAALEKTDVVIHLAGLAHIPLDKDKDQQKRCMQVNFHATRNLAHQAARAGVKRFVFISSANVLGKSDRTKRLRTVHDPLLPYDTYTRSKVLAEKSLMDIGKQTGMEFVILRPPLVYGPGVKANFRRLLALVHAGFPLPFAGMDNLRSYVARKNLVSAIALCAEHEQAANRIFLICDGHPISTEQLIKTLASAMGKPPRMIHIPSSLMQILLTLLGKSGIYERLWCNCQVDSSDICRTLGWAPEISWKQAMEETVQWYLKEVRCP